MEPSFTLLASTLFLLVAAIVYAHVGDRILRTLAARGEATRARNMFALWWYGVSLTTLAGAIPTFAAALGYADPAFHAAMRVLTISLLSGALCGLVYYLAFVFTGRSSILMPLVLAYAAFACLAAYYVVSGETSGVVIGRWQTELLFANEPPGLMRAVLFGFTIVPQLAGAIAYATLLHKTREPAQRYRITLVSLGIAVWSLGTLLLTAHAVPQTDAPQILIRMTTLGAIFMILAAYRPPAWVRRRLAAGTEANAGG